MVVNRRAFTLVETLVTVAVIAALLAVLTTLTFLEVRPTLSSPSARAPPA
jgi:prepilin-type N-terminal cleavage/methylation domain-containing protein